MLHISNTRDELLSLIPKNGKIAELGVFKGDFSQKILDTCSPKELILIDLFPNSKIGSGDVNGNNVEWYEGSELFNQVKDKFKGDESVKIIKDYTTCLDSFADEYFDMVYIDADHSYEGCKRDLEVAYQKVKSGGYIMCHDYEVNKDKCKEEPVFGVNQAVNEFCQEKRLEISYKGMDGCVTCVIAKRIPLFIISFNRLNTLKGMVEYLSKEPRVEVIIVDNCSTYPPLLEYLKETPHQVVRMSENFGYLVIWEQNLLQDVNSRYIISDSDLILDNIPLDWFDKLSEGLEKYPQVAKAGFSLDIFNLPKENPLTPQIVQHEQQFWINRADEDFFFSPTDTTFALYRETQKTHTYSAVRSDKPYMAIHEPWQKTPTTLTEEDRYYYSHIQTSTHWSQILQAQNLES